MNGPSITFDTDPLGGNEAKPVKMDGWKMKLIETNLQLDGWNTRFLLGWPIFRDELLVWGRVNDKNNFLKMPIFLGV